MALNGAPISWRSCRQGGVTLSSIEAEYVAASAVAQEKAYLHALLSGCDRSRLGPTCVWKDNAACILMSENPVNRDRSHHVDVKFHFLRERVRAGEIKLYKCWGPLNVADALTKSLPRPAFHKHAPFMHGTRSSYWPFTNPGAYILLSLFPCLLHLVSLNLTLKSLLFLVSLSRLFSFLLYGFWDRHCC